MITGTPCPRLIDMPPMLWKRFKIQAVKEETTIKDLIAFAMEEYLCRHEKK